MKKLIIISFLFCMHVPSYCQNLVFKVNCNDSLLMTIKGKYIKGTDNISPTSSVLPKAQFPEAILRMDAMHKLLLETYPQPIGMDGKWRRQLFDGIFSDDVNYSNGVPVCMYTYNCTFGSYTCVQNSPKEVFVFADVYDRFQVFVNQLGELQNDYKLDTMSIDGRKVYMLNPLIGTWKGYDLYGFPGLNFGCVILSRRGESPFIPVTRKQYLEYSLQYLDNFFGNKIMTSKELPFSTQQQIDETNQKLSKLKNDVIERYEKEMEKTRADNLLDTPAEIFAPFTISENTPIFATGPQQGKMLVTANRAYMRKDLPKYVPQFMVMYWSWVSDFPNYGGEQGVYYRKIFEANFPIEKLQEMIDR